MPYFYEDPAPDRHTMQVIEEEKAPVDTGLVTKDGKKIMRHPDRIRIGFQPAPRVSR
jgi:hypothetical protein